MSGERILLAEDDKFLRRAAEAILRESGFDVRTASDGEETLKQAQALPVPDLILLDMIMPRMLGLDVLTQLKASEATKNIPVVMLSNLSQDSDVKRAMDGGAVGYLVKSNLSLKDLASKVTSLLAVE
jgi:two-component system, OmpR family, alkaline phosphatase synthesis response regulator PhoP